jgi:hypothetical protein
MDIQEDIKKLLTPGFELDLFDASIASLNDKSNKLRYNNFAYSIRELSRHFLHRLASEENLNNCSWFEIETKDGKPSRAQRIKYSIQGGITDEQLQAWGFDTEDLAETVKAIKGTIDSLSKYTHINPEVFDLSEGEVEKYSDEVLLSFKKFVLTIDDYRRRLKQFLDGHIEEHMISSVISNYFENVDHLAPHYSLNFSEINNYHISEINSHEIVVDVFGDLHVTLEYGSRQQRREGDGLDLEQSFPFETKIRYEVDDEFPSANYEIDDYDVDTSDWYGDGDAGEKNENHPIKGK